MKFFDVLNRSNWDIAVTSVLSGTHTNLDYNVLTNRTLLLLKRKKNICLLDYLFVKRVNNRVQSSSCVAPYKNLCMHETAKRESFLGSYYTRMDYGGKKEKKNTVSIRRLTLTFQSMFLLIIGQLVPQDCDRGFQSLGCLQSSSCVCR